MMVWPPQFVAENKKTQLWQSFPKLGMFYKNIGMLTMNRKLEIALKNKQKLREVWGTKKKEV